MNPDPDRPATHPEPETHASPRTATETLDRRTALRRLGGLALGAALIGSAHGQGSTHGQSSTHGQGSTHGHGSMHGHGAAGHTMPGGHAPGAPMGGATGPSAADAPPSGPRAAGRPRAHAVPWLDTTCAFCSMTIATPEGLPQGAGFRERTYAQWSFGSEARHFESIGCAVGWAYAHGVTDGDGAALYAADYAGRAAMEAADLLDARTATFLWAEGLPTSMMARWGAFTDQRAAAAFVAAHEPAAGSLGRRRYADLAFLQDHAPLPLMNLIPLLARAAGLVG